MARLKQMFFALICLMIYYRTIEGIMVTFYGYGSGYHGQTVYLHGDCQPVKTFPVRGQAIIENNRWNVTVEMEPCSFMWKWRISEKIWEFINLGSNGIRVTSIPTTKRMVFVYSTFDANDVSVLELHDVTFILENLPNTTSQYTVCGKCETKPPFNDPNRGPYYWTQQMCSDSGTVKDNKVVINWIVISCHFLWSWSDNTNSRLANQNHFQFTNNLCPHQSISIKSSWSGPPKSHTCETLVSPTRPTSPAQSSSLSTMATSTAPQSISTSSPAQRSTCFSRDIFLQLPITKPSVEVEVTGTTKLILPAGNYTYLQNTEEGVCQVNIIIVTEENTKCPNKAVAAASSTTLTANVSLTAGGAVHTLELPVGIYPYFISALNHTCHTSLHVYDKNVVRRLDICANYKFPCKELLVDSIRQVLQIVIGYRYSDVESIVHGIANRSVEYKTSYECVNDTLTVTWPTSLVYPANVTRIPLEVYNRIRSKIADGRNLLELILLSNILPVLKPNVDTSGLIADAVLTSLCKNKMLYSADKDLCIES